MMFKQHADYSRRRFLSGAGGLSALALAQLMSRDRSAAATSPNAQHFPAKAKRVIWLFMHGGPSHVDLLDPKPELARRAGEMLPASMRNLDGKRGLLMPAVKPFHRRGKSGIEMSELLPHMGGVADELCLIRSCHGDSVNHPQSVYQMNTGSTLTGKPSVGAWVSYGLGSENENMPAFVVMPDPEGTVKGGPPAWGSGFLPASYQGTTVRAGGDPILNLKPASGMSDERERSTLDLVNHLNQNHSAEREFDPELQARLESYELAYRMQSAAPEVADMSEETAETKKLYGIDEPMTREFGTRCLLARRMAERGVRFVQLFAGNSVGWDAHAGLLGNHAKHCARTDKPVAGLLKDLKRRGLLEDTLVIWGGEFGRLPISEAASGRDHNPWGYTTILAGGGVKAGHVHGATDDFGLRAEKDPVHVSDLHATILHLLGIHHDELTFRFNGLDQRLTGQTGQVVQGVLA
jgi:hypothetical protein